MQKIVFVDHNAIDKNYKAIKEYASRMGIDIPFQGVEASVKYSNPYTQKMHLFHLLVYGKELLENKKFVKYVSRINKIQNIHIANQIKSLRKAYPSLPTAKKLFQVEDTKLQCSYHKSLYDRSTVARYLSEAYNLDYDHLKEVELPKIDQSRKYEYAPDMIALLNLCKENNYVTILAHPGWIRILEEKERTETNINYEEIIVDLKKAGLNGIEVNHRLNNDEMKLYLNMICDKYGLIKSGGSDFHGKKRCCFSQEGCQVEEYEKILDLVDR